ncbi:MAG: hypothetical protein PUB21_08105 [Bacteroidales bacterium]|nr:hypothetical protein [Bacteroidales bacterium]
MTYEETETIVMSVRRAYRSKDPKIKEALKQRKAETKALNKGLQPTIDDEYYCETCGSHSHKENPTTGYCYICNTDNWEKEEYQE